MKVLGIDPGTAVVGYGVVESGSGHLARLVECGVLQTKARDPLPARLSIIYDGIEALIARHRPDAVAVETAFYAKNVRTTMVLSHARGVILLAAERAGVAIGEYEPRLIKKTVVGRGGALKEQVGFMVAQLLRLKSAPTPADAADGVAVALTHLMLGRADRRAGGLAGGRAGGLADGRVGGLADGRVGGLADGRVGGLADGRIGGVRPAPIGRLER